MILAIIDHAKRPSDGYTMCVERHYAEMMEQRINCELKLVVLTMTLPSPEAGMSNTAALFGSLRGVDGSYAPYKPSALLTVRALSRYDRSVHLRYYHTGHSVICTDRNGSYA